MCQLICNCLNEQTLEVLILYSIHFIIKVLYCIYIEKINRKFDHSQVNIKVNRPLISVQRRFMIWFCFFFSHCLEILPITSNGTIIDTTAFWELEKEARNITANAQHLAILHPPLQLVCVDPAFVSIFHLLQLLKKTFIS